MRRSAGRSLRAARRSSEGGIFKQAAPAPNAVKLLRRCLTIPLTPPENCSLELSLGTRRKQLILGMWSTVSTQCFLSYLCEMCVVQVFLSFCKVRTNLTCARFLHLPLFLYLMNTGSGAKLPGGVCAEVAGIPSLSVPRCTRGYNLSPTPPRAHVRPSGGCNHILNWMLPLGEMPQASQM